MDVTELMEQLGNPGLFQIILYISLFVCSSTTAMNHLLMTVIGSSPAHNCRFPSGVLKDDAIPRTAMGVYEKCKMYAPDNTTTSCNAGWEFKDSATSIVTEWSLVCDDKYLVSTATTIYFAGVMIGGAVFGQLADRFGRKPILLLCMYGHIILGVGIYFVQSYEAFVALRFFVGFLIQGLQTSSYVLLIEMTALKYRPICAGIFEVFWAVGNLWMSSLAWLIKDWRSFQLALCLPSLITLFYIVFVPESIRWLVLQKKYILAEKVVQKIASFNKVEVPDNRDLYAVQIATKGDGEIYSFHDLFLTPNIRKRTLLMGYIWLSCSVGYYGLSLSAGALAGDRYVNIFISALMELTAFIITIFVLKYLPRRIPLMCYFLLGGITCIVAGSIKSSSFESKEAAATGFAITGKFFISAAFSTCFLFTVELFPTVVRTIGMGSCVFWARVGGMIAPQILLLGNYTFNELPYLIFGALSLLAGVATYFVPETRGIVLPDTIDAIEHMESEKLRTPADEESEVTKL